MRLSEEWVRGTISIMMALAIQCASLSVFAPNGNKLFFRYLLLLLASMFLYVFFPFFSVHIFSEIDMVLVLRNHGRIIVNNKKCRISEGKREISCCALKPSSQSRICRRDLALVVLGLTSVSLTLPSGMQINYASILSLTLLFFIEGQRYRETT